MNSNTKIVTEQEQEEFWALMSRPIRTIVLASDVLHAESSAHRDVHLAEGCTHPER
jgi:hypothetical protein